MKHSGAFKNVPNASRFRGLRVSRDPMNQPTDPAAAKFDLAPGLVDYYSSQAALMLTQFENINHLLGPTRDWTHPGDFCEILLRDFLRRFLPPNLNVDKGYIYGRATVGGKDSHCPEIDILIHDAHRYPPLFRMNDLVPNVFTGVVGFEDKLGDDWDFYEKQLVLWRGKCEVPSPGDPTPTSLYVLPDFVGSLKKFFIYTPGTTVQKTPYFALKSEHEGKNIALQVLLFRMQSVILSHAWEVGVFAFPAELKFIKVTDVPVH